MQLKAGHSTLEAVELEEPNSATGKILLHLQCHFGLDTFSWAREGAIVIGVDISDRGNREKTDGNIGRVAYGG